MIAKESGLGMQFVLPKTLVDNLLEEGNYPVSELYIDWAGSNPASILIDSGSSIGPRK